MMTIAEVLPVRDAHHKGVGNCSMIVIIMAWNHKQCHYMSCCVFVDAVWSRGSKSIYKIVSEKCVSGKVKCDRKRSKVLVIITIKYFFSLFNYSCGQQTLPAADKATQKHRPVVRGQPSLQRIQP